MYRGMYRGIRGILWARGAAVAATRVCESGGGSGRRKKNKNKNCTQSTLRIKKSHVTVSPQATVGGRSPRCPCLV